MSIRGCLDITAAHYGTNVETICGRRRTASIAKIRHVAAWLARRSGPYSLPQIARVMKRLDHTTILNSVKRVEYFRAQDCNFKAETDALLSKAMATAADRLFGRVIG